VATFEVQAELTSASIHLSKEAPQNAFDLRSFVDTDGPSRGGEPMSRLTIASCLLFFLGLAMIAAVILFVPWDRTLSEGQKPSEASLFGKWREATQRGGQKTAEPFHIAGNLYYVGANDVTSFLLTGPEGHVLIDGGYPGTPPLILKSIAKLGFDIDDVEVILSSDAHYDHAGGLAELREASGAELLASTAGAEALAAGGPVDKDTFLPLKLFFLSGLLQYPPPHVDRTFEDGETIRLGPIELTAHLTPGHVPGCTSWSFPVRDDDRELHVVRACELTPPPGTSMADLEKHPRIQEDFERTFRVLRSLPVDIFLTQHARDFDRYRKYRASEAAEDPVEPFIDPEGYFRYLDEAEKKIQVVTQAGFQASKKASGGEAPEAARSTE
jgi:metallo-beta-lactamase class B